MTKRSGRTHEERKLLFLKGLRRGWVSLEEVESAIPSDEFTYTERWLLFYSLRASGIEIKDQAEVEAGEGHHDSPINPE